MIFSHNDVLPKVLAERTGKLLEGVTTKETVRTKVGQVK